MCETSTENLYADTDWQTGIERTETCYIQMYYPCLCLLFLLLKFQRHWNKIILNVNTIKTVNCSTHMVKGKYDQ